MRCRPILMSGAMVRASLREIDPKTQTRRIVTPQPPAGCDLWSGWVIDSTCRKEVGKAAWGDAELPLCNKRHRVRCPYGQIGDRLWVRETTSESEPCFLGGKAQPTVWYRADNNRPMWADCAWTPSIFCPRGLSRLTLEITEVRVERLQDISDEDAGAEGIIRENLPPDPDNFHPPGSYGYVTGLLPFPQGRIHVTKVEAYRDLWESINDVGSWDANPWVWVVSFKRVAQVTA